ncbi:MAG: DUF4976 domain-containing protein, partial [Bacteroidetes bacterium]|nr:DUF4976 domain-containing protein [Bacteroidota bacterium]
HIPLLAMIPDAASGTVCNYPMSNLDIPATILDIAGCLNPDELDGKSFLPVLEGKSMPDDTPDFVVSEFFGHHYSYEARMLIYDKYKYVFHPSSCDELYDLDKDPWEMHNLINSQAHSEQRNACRIRLIDWAKDTGDELCVLCGLFHERITTETDYNYKKGTWQGLRGSNTCLI